MIVETLLASAERGGKNPAVADPTRELNYADLVRFSDVMRRQVERATSAPHVGLLIPSTVAFAGTFYGILWARRTAVPLNFLLQPAELAAVARDAEIDTVFTIKHFRNLAEGMKQGFESQAGKSLRLIYMEDLPLKREMVLERIRRRPPAPRVEPDETAVLLYTSGTSGVPKGVCQTYRNLRSDIDACIERAQLKGEHRFLGLLPLSHSFGLTAMLLVPVALGASVYYIPRFQPAAVIQAIREKGMSVTMMIASMYSALLHTKRGGPEDFKSLEYAVSGGEALQDAVYHEFKKRFGVEILQGYGMSEAAPVVSLNVPWENRVGTVGRAIPGVTVRAFDDDGNQLAPDQSHAASNQGHEATASGNQGRAASASGNQSREASASGGSSQRLEPAEGVGELWVRGPIIMKGYYKKPDETRAVLTDDGWYKTGDMGKVDAEGFITITGRKKEMIIVGGENVFPREIEAVLEQHPAVKEAAAIGEPDSSRGEVVVAFVTLADGKKASDIELRDFCRDRIAGYKVPRRVIVSDDLPRGPTGKILKRKLKDLL